MRRFLFWVVTCVLVVFNLGRTVEDFWTRFGPGLKVYIREGNFKCADRSGGWLKGEVPEGSSLPFVNLNGSTTSNVGYFKDYVLALRREAPPRVAAEKLCTYSQIARFDIINESSRPYTGISLRYSADTLWADRPERFLESSELGELAPGESVRVYVWSYSGEAGSLQTDTALRVGQIITHSTGRVHAMTIEDRGYTPFWELMPVMVLRRAAIVGALIWLAAVLFLGRKQKEGAAQAHGSERQPESR
jgi:hypothetical protein